MRRRALLAGLAAGTAGVAGCSLPGSTDSATPTDRSSTDDVTPVPTGESPATPTDDPGEDPGTEQSGADRPRPDGRASVVELETGPRTYAFAPTRMHTDDGARVALWFDRTATADHPARLVGWLENGNDYENTFEIEWIPAVGRTHARQPRGYDHEAQLHLAPTEGNDLAKTVPSLARTDEGYWHVEDIGPWLPETYRMEPGEVVDLEYVLVGEPGMPGRPTGTYEFRGRDDDARVAVWDTTSPGPETKSRFAGRSPPAFEGDGTVAWYHDADRTTRAFVRPSTERLELDGLVEFEVVNHSHGGLRCGHWNLHKLVDGEWFHVAPRIHTSDCRILSPGDRKQWSLRAFNGEAVPCGTTCGGSAGLTRGYLGGGEYAVVVGYGHPTDDSAALVELVGDPVSLTTTDDARIERDGDTITVTTDRYGDGEHPPDATFTLTRTDSAERRLIAEQLTGDDRFGARGRGLGNALAALTPDADRVVVRADDHAVDRSVGHNGSARRFQFRGQAYEASRGAAEP